MSNEAFWKKKRLDFPALQVVRNGKQPIYLDNACNTLVPQTVIDSLVQYYACYPACGGQRSAHWFSKEVNNLIDGLPAWHALDATMLASNVSDKVKGSREIVQEFINAKSASEVIFTLNATLAINMVALGFPFSEGDVVLLSGQEHNSNLVPWLRLQELKRIRVCIVNAEDVNYNPDEFLCRVEDVLKKERVKLVAMGMTSNLTGWTIPAASLVKIAHSYGAKVMLDGAQTVPHQPVDVQALDADFLAFSVHKMCGPRGIGILYGKREFLGAAKGEPVNAEFALRPVILGGDTVADTTYGSYELLNPPSRFEAGLQDYAGQIATGKAIQYLAEIGLQNVHQREIELNRFLTASLMKRFGDRNWFEILGPREPDERGGILSFVVRQPDARDLDESLDERNNIMVRKGTFCVHADFNGRYGVGWADPKENPWEQRMAFRISTYLYNSVEECEVLVDTLDEIFRQRGYV